MGTEATREGRVSTEAKKPPKRTSADLLDYGQVANELNVSEASVRRLVSCGKLPSVPVTPSGRKRMISRAALATYLRENDRPATPVDEPDIPMTEPRRARLKRAGWDGDQHL
jgi:excisionase family DNA binding protein